MRARPSIDRLRAWSTAARLVTLAGLGLLAICSGATSAGAHGGCVGDCSRHGQVTMDNLLTMVSIALDTDDFGACVSGDRDGSATVTVDEIITAARNSANQCSIFLPTLQPWQEVPDRIAVPRPARVKPGAAEAERLAGLWFDLHAPAVDAGDRWTVSAGDRHLELSKTGDSLRYREPTALSPGPPESNTAASAAAQVFLATEGWGGTEVVWGKAVPLAGADGTPRAWRVPLQVELGAGEHGGTQMRAHVHGAEGSIDVGSFATGRFVGADLHWFGLADGGAAPTLPTIAPPLADAAEALDTDPDDVAVHFLYEKTGNAADAPLAPWYLLAPRNVPLELVLQHENPFGAQLAPASTAAPVALFDATPFNTPQDVGQPIKLTALVKLGTPPYEFEWRSDRLGLLGRGNPITVAFPTGQHLIELMVRDAAGRTAPPVVDMLVATGQGTLVETAPAANLGAAAAALEAEAVSKWTWRAETTPGDGIAFRDVKLVRDLLNGKTEEWPNQTSVIAREVTVPGFRYRMTISGAGLATPVYLDSGKCDLVTGGTLACGRQTTMSLTSGPTQDGERVQATYMAENLPGTLRLTVNYQFGLGAFCTPGLGTIARAVMGLALPNALSGTRAGQCAAFRPELIWSYEPPPTCLNGPTIAAACEGIAGAWRCPPAVGSMLRDAGNEIAARVTDFELTLYTRILTFGAGAPGLGVFVQDGASLMPPSIPKTNGPKHCDDRLGAITELLPSFLPSQLAALGDAFCAMEPIAVEDAGQFAVENAPAGQPAGTDYWDNVHLKVRDGPFDDPATQMPYRAHFIYFPQGNDPLDERDVNATIHIHERWPESRARGLNSSLGQNVRMLLVAERPGEEDPEDPGQLVNGDAVREAGGLVLWHISRASSRRCDPVGSPQTPGLVDNTHRPCHVFTSPLFMSGPYDELPDGTPTEWDGYQLTPLSGPLPGPQPMCEPMRNGPPCSNNPSICFEYCASIPGLGGGECLPDGSCGCYCDGRQAHQFCQDYCGTGHGFCGIDGGFCCEIDAKYGCICNCDC